MKLLVDIALTVSVILSVIPNSGADPKFTWMAQWGGGQGGARTTCSALKSNLNKFVVDCSFDVLQLPHLSMTLDWHLVVRWKRLRRWEHTPLQRTWLCEDLSSVCMGMCKARLKLQWDVDGCGPFGPTYNPSIGSAQTEVVAWTSSSTYSIWGTSTVLTNATLNRWNH